MTGGEERGGNKAHSPSTKEPFIKPELPSCFTLYIKVLDELNSRMADYINAGHPLKKGADKPREALQENDDILWLKFFEDKKPLILPTVGSDEVRLETIVFERLDDPKKAGTLLDHDFIILQLNLFQHCMPRVADGDRVEDDYGYTDMASDYFILLGREGPAIITQQLQIVDQEDEDLDDFTITHETYGKARKHELTNLECDRVLEFVKALPIPSDVLTN